MNYLSELLNYSSIIHPKNELLGFSEIPKSGSTENTRCQISQIVNIYNKYYILSSRSICLAPSINRAQWQTGLYSLFSMNISKK